MGRAIRLGVVRGGGRIVSKRPGWMFAAPLVAAAGMLAAQPHARGQVLLEADAARLPQVDLALLASPIGPAPRNGGAVQLAAPGASTSQFRGSASDLNLALRWRPGSVAGHRVEGQLWHRVSPLAGDPAAPTPLEEPSYGARVEMQLRPDKPLAALRDILGMQMDNGARISLRPSKGKISIYYKLQF